MTERLDAVRPIRLVNLLEPLLRVPRHLGSVVLPNRRDVLFSKGTHTGSVGVSYGRCDLVPPSSRGALHGGAVRDLGGFVSEELLHVTLHRSKESVKDAPFAHVPLHLGS